MRSAPATSSSRRGTSASSPWSQLVSMNATKRSRAPAKLMIASCASTSTVRWDSAVLGSGAASPALPSRATWSSSDASTYSSAPATSSSVPSSAGRLPATTSRSVSRCCITTSRATPRPIMPSVSATLPSSATCGSRSWASLPVRRCRSSASFTRSSSSFTALPTVSSSSRLRPLRLLRAWSISASLGAATSPVPGWNSMLSLSPDAPRAARISLSSGSSTIGMSRWPSCRRSR